MAAGFYGANRIGKAEVPAATWADHSPSECPAARAGCTPCSASTRHAATLTVKMAGWVFSVSFRSSSGPSKSVLKSGSRELRRLRQRFARRWEELREIAAHADGLRTLAWKEKCKFGVHAIQDFTPTSKSAECASIPAEVYNPKFQ